MSTSRVNAVPDSVSRGQYSLTMRLFIWALVLMFSPAKRSCCMRLAALTLSAMAELDSPFPFAAIEEGGTGASLSWMSILSIRGPESLEI